MPSQTPMKQVRFKDEIFEQDIKKYLDTVFKSKEQMVLVSLLQNSVTIDLVKALSFYTTLIKNQELVNAIIALEWIERDLEFIHHYMHLLESLVSSQASLVIPISKMILSHITTKHSLPQDTIFERIHFALQKILLLIPSGPSSILPLLKQLLPHKSEPVEVLNCYVKSLITIMGYASVLTNELVQLIVELIVQMDIDIQTDEDDEDVPVFQMDDVHQDSDDDDDSVICISTNQKLMITKLDGIMQLLIQFIDSKTTQEREELFYAFMDSFEKSILPTLKLKCSQFLLFYICSLDPNLAEEFMGLLMTRLIHDSNVLGLASVSYLASFIARAKYVSIESVMHCLKLLNSQCQQYIVQDQGTELFYACVQAILYVFCFRWKQMNLQGVFPTELNGFQNVLQCKSQPLQVCSVPIVEEFSKITLDLNIMYCYTLLDTKGLKTRLDSFFPFDPIPLPNTRGLIGEYQEWEEEEEVAEVEVGELGTSFQGMSLDSALVSL